MGTHNIQGLTLDEVSKKRKLGLTNEVIDSYTPSTFTIFRRNILSLINVVIFPLLIVLVIYELYRDVLAFSTFLIINTVISILDELRIKKQLEKLKSEFQIKVTVIREGKEVEIPTLEIVEGDFIKAKEGEGIIADGEIVEENYFQIDESALNGESNYIRKYKNEKVFSGSYVVTGNCIYRVLNIGKNNYLNKLGNEALKFKEKRSPLQRNGDRVILFLVVAAISMGVLNFYTAGLNPNTEMEQRILGLTTIISLIIPQTLIFLFTLTFTISITKLYNKGVLVQKGGSIEELSNINVICFDKTGTITTNEMRITDVKYFNSKEEEIASFYNSIKNQIVSVNKTQEIINKYYSNYPKFEIDEFDQIPFTSKNKFSLVTAKVDNKYKTLVFGAFSMLKANINDTQLSSVQNYVSLEEKAGNRVLVGLLYNTESKFIDTKQLDLNITFEETVKAKSDQVIVFTIEETLNPGIKQIVEDLQNQSIKVKIISGDSMQSVSRVMQRLGLNSSNIVDLSENQEDLNKLVNTKDIFTRAKPEDKLTIIKALQATGNKVAMVGDGINDVLSLKASDVAIAMEGGSKIAREVSDIVLLNNDYKKIPMIFFEGENIIFNLKTTTKIFLTKSIFAILASIYFSLQQLRFPMDPSSTLIFSFLGGSAPSYVLIFTRQKIQNSLSFFKDVLSSAIPSSAIITTVFVLFYLNLRNFNLSFAQVNSALIILMLALTINYSLFLCWEAKKLKNFFVVAFFYVLIMIVGTYETLLPLNPTSRTREELIILTSGLLLGALIVAIVGFKALKPKKLISKLLLIIGSIALLTVAAIFPFQTYYSVASFPAVIHLQINILGLVTIIGIMIVNRIIKGTLLKVHNK